MTRDHALIEELLAVRSLGGLDGDDVQTLGRELAAHGDCHECQRLEAEFAQTAGRLAFALDPEPIDASIADAIVGSGSGAPQSVEPPLDGGGARRGGRSWRGLAAAAAAAVLVVAGFVAFGTARSTNVQRATLSQRVVLFTGTGGQLAMAYEPGKPGAVFYGTGFSDPGAGKTYEIWMFRGTTPIRGGCVTPVDGVVSTSLSSNLEGDQLMAVTVESAACPAQPTTSPILTAQLTPA